MLHFSVFSNHSKVRHRTGGGATPAHFIASNERQSLPQKYAKFAAFTEFMVICVALLMLLNLHLTNGSQLPSPSPFLSHYGLHLDDEISAQRALALPAHSLSIPVSICLSVVPFWPSFKTFSVTFCILQFQYAFLMIPIRWNWKTKPTMMQLMKCPGTQMQTGSENYWEYSYAITVAVAIPITVASYSLQSAVSRQAGRQAKLNTPSSFRFLGDCVCVCAGPADY